MVQPVSYSSSSNANKPEVSILLLIGTINKKEYDEWLLTFLHSSAKEFRESIANEFKQDL